MMMHKHHFQLKREYFTVNQLSHSKLSVEKSRKLVVKPIAYQSNNCMTQYNNKRKPFSIKSNDPEIHQRNLVEQQLQLLVLQLSQKNTKSSEMMLNGSKRSYLNSNWFNL